MELLGYDPLEIVYKNNEDQSTKMCKVNSFTCLKKIDEFANISNYSLCIEKMKEH